MTIHLIATTRKSPMMLSKALHFAPCRHPVAQLRTTTTHFLMGLSEPEVFCAELLLSHLIAFLAPRAGPGRQSTLCAGVPKHQLPERK